MTHFNHEWDGSPAIPEAVGDRYYAQDLNDDFNYLKHLPYEVFLQGRSRGIMIAPSDTWDNDTNSLTLSGGFGVILQDNLCVDPDEDFVVPPTTKNSPRYERVPLVDTTLILPNDSATHYIVATPTKRSLLQRIKTVLSESYASRIRYDGVITIQDTAPTAGQILIGLCHDKEYCLLIDNNPDQCKDNIILKKWFGQSKITQDFIPVLQSYYNTTVDSIETKISIDTIGVILNIGINGGTFNNCNITFGTIQYIGGSTSQGIYNGTFNNCNISIDTVTSSGCGIYNGTFNNCNISIDTVTSSGCGINGGTFNNCNITFDTITDMNVVSIGDGTFNYCTISIDTVTSSSQGISNGTFNNCNISIDTDNNTGIGDGVFNNCTISIDTVTSIDIAVGIVDGTFSNCNISIGTVTNLCQGVFVGIFNNCTISIDTVTSNGQGISNAKTVYLYLTRIICSAITNLSNTSGKLNVLNNTVLHAS